MYRRLCVTVFFIGLLLSVANAGGVPAIPFVDGLWRGDIETDPDSAAFKECWASTTTDDGTMLTLAKRDDGRWHLQLSNPAWRLPPSHRYYMTALVDFYPQQVRTAAEAKSATRLEIADLDRISLLGLIENGHTLFLTTDGFKEKYDLEGSAKIIARIRTCFTDQLANEKPAIVDAPNKKPALP